MLEAGGAGGRRIVAQINVVLSAQLLIIVPPPPHPSAPPAAFATWDDHSSHNPTHQAAKVEDKLMMEKLMDATLLERLLI